MGGLKINIGKCSSLLNTEPTEWSKKSGKYDAKDSSRP